MNLYIENCTLCNSKEISHYYDNRYFKCNNCDLIFLSPKFQISQDEEKKRYSTHNNDPLDPNYRKFLNRLMEPVIHQINIGDKGLDFGSGPGPTLSIMFQEKGFNMNIFDPFFADNQSVLEEKYDFVTSSEVVEHFSTPAKSWMQLINLVKPKGTLGIMTEIFDKNINFEKWYYKNDDTHVSFYSLKTFSWIEKYYNLTKIYNDSRVIIFKNDNKKYSS